MPKSRVILTLLLLFIIVLLLDAERSSAQDGGHAAVIVRYGDDEVVSRCVYFEEPITGYEALRRGGFNVDAGFNIQGGKVCKIDGTGCPAGDCFCQCEGGDDCVYWSYWHQAGGFWEYSTVGASAYQISDGSIEGWSWGPGTISQAIEPPQLDFDAVCDENSQRVQASPNSEQGSIIGSNWLQVALIGALLGVFIAAAVYFRSRRNSS